MTPPRPLTSRLPSVTWRAFLQVVPVALCACASAGPLAYVTNQGSDDVSVIDLTSGRRLASVPVGHAPVGVSVLQRSHQVVITSPESHDIQVIDASGPPEQSRLIRRIPLGGLPLGIDRDESRQRFYVTDMADNRLIAFDTRSLETVGQVGVGHGAGGIAIDDATGRIYVANRDDDTVTQIEPDHLQRERSITVGEHPFGMAVDAAARRLYVANVYGNSVSVVDLVQGREVARIAVGNSPYCLLVNAPLNRLYVSNQHDDTLSILDTQSLSVIATVPTGGYPEGLSLHPDGSRFYVVNWMDDAISEHDATTGKRLRGLAGGKNNRGFGNFILDDLLPAGHKADEKKS